MAESDTVLRGGRVIDPESGFDAGQTGRSPGGLAIRTHLILRNRSSTSLASMF
jgi:hypothetical protein